MVPRPLIDGLILAHDQKNRKPAGTPCPPVLDPALFVHRPALPMQDRHSYCIMNGGRTDTGDIRRKNR